MRTENEQVATIQDLHRVAAQSLVSWIYAKIKVAGHPGGLI